MQSWMAEQNIITTYVKWQLTKYTGSLYLSVTPKFYTKV